MTTKPKIILNLTRAGVLCHTIVISVTLHFRSTPIQSRRETIAALLSAIEQAGPKVEAPDDVRS